MSFRRYDEYGNQIRNRAVIDCSNDELKTEQSHKDEVNINNIVRRHGIDLIQKISAMQEFRYDDVTGNDFQESMNMLLQAEKSFKDVPSDIRKQFDNDPAKFMDYIHNPENTDQLKAWGLMEKDAPPPKPLQVVMVDPSGKPIVETPPAEQPAP